MGPSQPPWQLASLLMRLRGVATLKAELCPAKPGQARGPQHRVREEPRALSRPVPPSRHEGLHYLAPCSPHSAHRGGCLRAFALALPPPRGSFRWASPTPLHCGVTSTAHSPKPLEVYLFPSDRQPREDPGTAVRHGLPVGAERPDAGRACECRNDDCVLRIPGGAHVPPVPPWDRAPCLWGN